VKRPISIFLAIQLLGFTTMAHAANTKIFSCSTKNSNYSAQVDVDVTLKARLLVFTTNKQKHECALKIRWAEDGLRAVRSGFFFDFGRLNCTPHLESSLEKSLLAKPNLDIQIEREKPFGSLQWLSTSQPEACQFEVFRFSETRLAIKKWRASFSKK
jgi:hypothetical protein